MEIIIYTMKGCPFCESAKGFLNDREIRFIEAPAQPGTENWREMKKRTGSDYLPQILIDGVPLGGYSDLVNLEATGELYEKLGMPDRKPGVLLYDVIILGAGPAGLSAAIYSIRKLLKTLVIGKEMGGQLTWTSDIDNYLGFSQVSAMDLIAKFQEHVKKYEVETVTGLSVRAADLAGRIKRITMEDGKVYFGKTVIIATGGKHRPLDIPGEREFVAKGVSYCSTCDAPLYEGADVAVVGGGNSALEAALDLVGIANKVYLVSLTPLTGDPHYQSKLMLAGKVEVFTEHQPVRVLGENAIHGFEFRSLRTGEIRAVSVEGIFVEIGILPNSCLFVDTLATNPKGEILVDTECRTGLAGVFACGDVTNIPYKQVVVAVGDGSKAALSAYYYLLNRK